jgi:hypothetical protein
MCAAPFRYPFPTVGFDLVRRADNLSPAKRMPQEPGRFPSLFSRCGSTLRPGPSAREDTAAVEGGQTAANRLPPRTWPQVGTAVSISPSRTPGRRRRDPVTDGCEPRSRILSAARVNIPPFKNLGNQGADVRSGGWLRNRTCGPLRRPDVHDVPRLVIPKRDAVGDRDGRVGVQRREAAVEPGDHEALVAQQFLPETPGVHAEVRREDELRREAGVAGELVGQGGAPGVSQRVPLVKAIVWSPKANARASSTTCLILRA